jgi:hypothetical protein
MNLTDRLIDALSMIRARARVDRLAHAPPPVFVVGTGRSGTHWVGYILDSHPDILVTVERPPMFQWVKQMALDPSLVPALLPRLVGRYNAYRSLAAPRVYADKSHPNIWLADELMAAFPGARFLGVLRSVRATVASMLMHRGVLRTIEQWERYPLPNRFLGIDEGVADRYRDMSLVERCALRWVAHANRLDELAGRLPAGNFLRLNYDAMATDPTLELQKLQEFLALDKPFPPVDVKRDALEKWRSQLSVDDLLAIDAVVDRYRNTPAGDHRDG